MAIWHEEYELYRKYIHDISRFYKQNERIKAYLELGLSLAAVAIFLVFAIRPTAITISERIRELSDKQNIVMQLDQKINSLTLAQELLQNEQSTLALLQDAVPNGSLPEDYIIQIDALARRNGLVLETINIEDTPLISEENVDAIIQYFPFTVVVTGSFESLLAFLDSVENLRRPIRFTAVNIQEAVDVGLRLTINGEIPYLND